MLIGGAWASELFAGNAYYLGDLHVHTGVSGDGCSTDIGRGSDGDCPFPNYGAALDVLDVARTNGLDFVAVTDHLMGNFTGDAEEWATVYRLVVEGHDPEGGLVTVPGVELQFDLDTGGTLGHKNLLLFGDNDVLAELTFEQLRPDVSLFQSGNCKALWSWVGALETRVGPAMMIPHHPGVTSPSPTDWSCHDPRFQPAVELYSEHGNSMRVDSDFDVDFSPPVASGTVHAALDPDQYGLSLGFLSSTDTHDSYPGDTCTTAEERYGGGLAVAVLPAGMPFDRNTLRKALFRHRTYATSGPLLPVQLAWSSEGAVLGGLGDAVAVQEGAALHASVRVPPELAPLVTQVTLVEPNGDTEMTSAGSSCWTVTLEEPEPWAYVRLTLDGDAWYGEAGCDDDSTWGDPDPRERLWLSPSLITRVVGDSAALAADPGPLGCPPDDSVTTDTAISTEDTDTPTRPRPPPKAEGCGCSTRARASPGAQLWLVGLLGWRGVRGRPSQLGSRA